MKLTLSTFLTTVLCTCALTACTQEQGGSVGMGETEEETQTEQAETQPETQSRGQGGTTDQQIDLPEESPAAGGTETQSPDTGVQEPPSSTEQQSPSPTSQPEYNQQPEADQQLPGAGQEETPPPSSN